MYKQVQNRNSFKKTNVILMLLSLSEGPDRKRPINALYFLMIWNLPPASADLPDQVSFATARDLPSTRAGGQDDVSSNKLPQNPLEHARF